MADSKVTSFFQNKKKTQGTKIKAFKVAAPSVVTSNGVVSSTSVGDGVIGGEGPRSKRVSKEDDGWIDEVEDDAPQGFFLQSSSTMLGKVAEIKESEEEHVDPEMGELMARESARDEWGAARKALSKSTVKPQPKAEAPAKVSWRDKEAQKASTSLNNDAAFPTLSGRAAEEKPLPSANYTSVNCWNTLVGDDDDDEDRDTPVEPVKVAVHQQGSPKKVKSKETAAEKAAAENAALEAAIEEVKHTTANEPAKETDGAVAIDARFANKKKKKKKSTDDDDD